MNSNIKTLRVTATGDTGLGPTRIVGVHVMHTSGGAGRLTVRETSATGSIEIDMDYDAGADTDCTNFAGYGVKFDDLVWVSALTNITAVTFFYVG